MEKKEIQNKERFEALLKCMNEGLYGKETEVSMALLAMVAGESLLLLGPPGVAKSMVARSLKNAIKGGNAFEYLMSRFSTPDEIFGPVSISKLKDSDAYERVTSGYMPTADVAFLDEIWKAGPAIQNSLLTIINEKIFRNGDHDVKVPLKLLVAASNELPSAEEGLEALWDRFLIRIVSTCIADKRVFKQMLLDDAEMRDIPKQLQITQKEFAEWKETIKAVELGDGVLEAICKIRENLKSVRLAGRDDIRSVYVSDRRWKHIVQLLKTSAFMNGRTKVSVADIPLVSYCLWNEPDEIDDINRIVVQSLFSELNHRLSQIQEGIYEQSRVAQLKKAITNANNNDFDPDRYIRIYDHFYYHIQNHGTGHSFIPVADYKSIVSNEDYKAGSLPTDGVCYTDPKDPQRTIFSLMAEYKSNSKMLTLSTEGKAESVKLLRSPGLIYINGVRYFMSVLNPGETQEPIQLEGLVAPNNDYFAEVDQLAQQINAISNELKTSLFYQPKLDSLVNEMLQPVKERILNARRTLELTANAK